MIDIHSHIIFGVDDGPKTIEESLKMLSEAENLGIKIIIATPHFKNDPMNSDLIWKNYNLLLNIASEFNITLMLGSEVSIFPLLDMNLKNSAIPTLGGVSHMLVEFPESWIPAYTENIIYNLQLDGITTIIAHPERSRGFLDNLSIIKGFFEKGCMFQVDSASVLGFYGNKVKRFTEKIIKSNMVHFIASDAHYPGDYSRWYIQSFEHVKRFAGEACAEKLFFKNANDAFNSTKHTIRSKSR